jgi:hypothetical protein
MDAKVSRKERRLQPDGPVDVLVDNIFDFYPIFADSEKYIDQDIYIGQDRVSAEERKNLIMDIEMLDNDRQELLDRAMFALVKQRGNDPVEPGDGIQWAEAVAGEVPSPVIVQQVHSSVSEEGPGVRAIPSTVKNGDRENLIFAIELTNAL